MINWMSGDAEDTATDVDDRGVLMWNLEPGEGWLGKEVRVSPSCPHPLDKLTLTFR